MNPSEEEEISDFSLAESMDKAILMHRDAHFGGSFSIMIDYYEKGGKGVIPEFDLDRIQELASIEARTRQNLAATLLSGPEAEKVSRARDAYQKLKDLYEAKGKNKYPSLIADLILSEEEDPQETMATIVAEKGAIVPSLILLLTSEELNDPLFPGYGLAPALAAKCLGMIGDKRAIISLYEAIGESDFFNEDYVLDALKNIGQPAKEFLLKVLHGRPLNFDNERAAIALVEFRHDPEVAKACFDLLQDPEAQKDIPLCTYLTLACEGLKNKFTCRSNFFASNFTGLKLSLSYSAKLYWLISLLGDRCMAVTSVFSFAFCISP